MVSGDAPEVPTQDLAGFSLLGEVFLFSSGCRMDQEERLGLWLVIGAACLSALMFAVIAVI
ncbi:hypothetical protein N826_06325 [Skermanella aerolata KACC 11604]|nr:hypothetical protein N826_06325 [Skermanella aerolata KACC 11604]